MFRLQINSHDVWTALESNWHHFFWFTGETPHTLNVLVQRIDAKFMPYYHGFTRSKLDLKNQVSYSWLICKSFTKLYWKLDSRNNVWAHLFQILMTMIWLRKYPTMEELAVIFGLRVGSVHKILHKFSKILHIYLVPKYIRWHTMGHWRRLAGTYPEWPRVVAILDCTPFRISKPTGQLRFQNEIWENVNNCCLSSHIKVFFFSFRSHTENILSCW